MNNKDKVKSVLKYNGQDYITIKTPEKMSSTDVRSEEIIEGGKGVAQVIIALDCSYGMRTTKVNYLRSN